MFLQTFNRFITLAFIAAVFIQCSSETKPTGLVTDKAMVVSAREEASAIGIEILKKGGNAFDAMVATELALAVAYPFAGNIGGGGFMVYRKANGDVGSIDYREKAPSAAHRDLYLDENGDVIPCKSTLGATAVGVPGTIAGIVEVHDKLGSLPFETILAPVIALARKGVVVTEKQAKSMASQRNIIAKISGEKSLFAQSYKKGDTIKYTALAETLTAIAKGGKDAFYKGEIATKIAQFIQERGGYITEEDLANYEAVWRQPIIFKYKDLKIISMSPPSSGGVTMSQIFKMMEPYPLETYGHNSEKTIQLFTEAARRAYADRNYFLGDPDYSPIPLDIILSNSYLKKRMSNFSFDKATPSSEVSHGDIQIIESEQTTHYSIIDQQGNAVSVTTTLNGAFGSKLYQEELGFFFNNEMDDFSAKAGVSNMFGLIGAEANSIAPGKRMLSSMTPTIVEKEGQLWMVVGTPGGSTIITAVVQTILNAYEFKLSMQEAVNAPRFHHQWLPDILVFEPKAFSTSTIKDLKNKGYLISEKSNTIIGKVDAIRVLKDGRLEAGADPRGDDIAVGF